MPGNPCAAIVLDVGIRGGMHRPMVEGAFSSRLAGDMAPPMRLARDDRGV